MPRETLADLVDRLAGQAEDVDSATVVEGTEYRRNGQPFAVASEAAVELRLNPEVADAARRTPDTGASTRGVEWVRFVPSNLDQHDRDRVEAWFRSAWRRAGD